MGKNGQIHLNMQTCISLLGPHCNWPLLSTVQAISRKRSSMHYHPFKTKSPYDYNTAFTNLLHTVFSPNTHTHTHYAHFAKLKTIS